MATSKQEGTYNEIIQYYDYAEKLIQIAENCEGEISEQQFEIIEETISKLEKCADFLANTYIEYVQNNSNPNLQNSVRTIFNDISARIEECRNKILILHHKNN